MEGGWGFNAFEFDDFEPNIDDSEDFNLGSTENSKRFGPPLSEKALDQATSDRIPEKTRKTTQWAVSVFPAWCDARGVKDATENMTIEVLADLLLRFVMEAHCQNETPYPPATLMQLLAGIQRHFARTASQALPLLVIRTLALHRLVVLLMRKRSS